MDDEMFVVADGESRVRVYDSHSLTVKPDINVSDMKSPWGIAGCSYNKALYISDCQLECIHRVDLTNNSVTRWKMRENR